MTGPSPKYPALYQVNTRVWLTRISGPLGRPATLDDVPDSHLDRFAASGFDWIWLLSVWQTGPIATTIARTIPGLLHQYRQVLPDLTPDDIGGSGFAVAAYTVHQRLGGDAALARLRERLRSRGLKLMLDFVPNHLAPDHAWVHEHPEYFVAGTEADLVRAPHDYGRAATAHGHRVLAHGRDPNFPGWSDTFQLDYGNAAVHTAMTTELGKIAGQCDGVRCDMAMLLLPEVFEKTWGRRPPNFWPAAIAAVKQRHPAFCFMAEAYWDLEWTMQQQGFDYAYDKRLYDRLCHESAPAVRGHLTAAPDYQDRLARFLENHDEPRAAAAFPAGRREAAAVITYLVPGLRFFHQGQLEGRTARIPVQLVRGPDEPANPVVRHFYDRLLDVLRRPEVRSGRWVLLECAPAWDGNGTHQDMLAFAWRQDGRRLLVCVNFSDHDSQCYVPMPFDDLGATCRLSDLLGSAVYDRDGAGLRERGLYLDVPAWQCHAFEVASA